MNGKYLLDTNAVIALLNGNNALSNKLQSATWVGISIITKLEFLAFKGISASDLALFAAFEKRIQVIGLDNSVPTYLADILTFRKTYHFKLPDAIIAATSNQYGTTLLTLDAEFIKASILTVEGF